MFWKFFLINFETSTISITFRFWWDFVIFSGNLNTQFNLTVPLWIFRSSVLIVGQQYFGKTGTSVAMVILFAFSSVLTLFVFIFIMNLKVITFLLILSLVSYMHPKKYAWFWQLKTTMHGQCQYSDKLTCWIGGLQLSKLYHWCKVL